MSVNDASRIVTNASIVFTEWRHHLKRHSRVIIYSLEMLFDDHNMLIVPVSGMLCHKIKLYPLKTLSVLLSTSKHLFFIWLALGKLPPTSAEKLIRWNELTYWKWLA